MQQVEGKSSYKRTQGGSWFLAAGLLFASASAGLMFSPSRCGAASLTCLARRSTLSHDVHSRLAKGARAFAKCEFTWGGGGGRSCMVSAIGLK